MNAPTLQPTPKAAVVYLDESGDLGWSLDASYGAGGSSRFLTIATICIPPDKKHLPKRLIRGLYQKFGWPTSVEKKWSRMLPRERSEFARAARVLCEQHPDISLHSITVKKQNVQEHIRHDSNKLYNYMIRLSLVDLLAGYDDVTQTRGRSKSRAEIAFTTTS